MRKLLVEEKQMTREEIKETMRKLDYAYEECRKAITFYATNNIIEAADDIYEACNLIQKHSLALSIILDSTRR